MSSNLCAHGFSSSKNGASTLVFRAWSPFQDNGEDEIRIINHTHRCMRIPEATRFSSKPPAVHSQMMFNHSSTTIQPHCLAPTVELVLLKG